MTQPPAGASTLPPYSGPDVDCPKCGASGATTEHRPARDAIFLPWNPAVRVDGPQPERMFRRCSSCGYGWNEAPLDAEPCRAVAAVDVGGLEDIQRVVAERLAARGGLR
ncbi:hypothetical protein GCM10010404_81290 [Nonomuraea africana]|uniref:Ribosomal protein S27AE n=1 Tax=Nonomuraea africana TaxID=46171 RepID=A0ABR9KWU5_9ACTN|nr:hypothetical protein [Nonomuraea africana]MBE1566493.1 ribosomal protein S27AE [Nonomuraea africana]